MNGEALAMPLRLETTQHNFKLEYDEKRMRFRLQLCDDEEDDQGSSLFALECFLRDWLYQGAKSLS